MRTLKYVVFATLLATVPLALADPFNPFNPRPVTVNPAPAGEANLQDILDAQCPGCFDVHTDQNSAGYWRLETSPPTGIFPIVIVEWAGYAPSNIVGLFSGDPTNRRDVFLGSAGGGTSAGILWTGLNSGVITRVSGPLGSVNEGPFTGISYVGFGFYIRPQGGDTYYYTVDDLNPGKAPQVLAFRKTGSNTWFLAFEDLLVGNRSDRDYNDFVMKVESIVPVPEPAAILLVGSVLLLIGRRLRARA